MAVPVPSWREELTKLTKEQLLDYIEVCHKTVWSLQNEWMMNVNQRYGSQAAAEFDEMLWAKWPAVEAHRLKRFLNLGDTLADFVKCRLYSIAIEENMDEEYVELTDKRLHWRVTKCPMQLRRRQDGLDELHCKPAFTAMWKALVEVINPNIRIVKVYAPRDPHPDDDWCGAILELD